MKAFRHILAVMAILSVFSSGYAIQVRRVPGSIYYDAPPASHDNPVLWTAGPVPMTKAALPGAYATKDALRTGTPECLVVLADFNDRHFTTQDTLELRNYYHRFFNESGFTPNHTMLSALSMLQKDTLTTARTMPALVNWSASCAIPWLPAIWTLPNTPITET